MHDRRMEFWGTLPGWITAAAAVATVWFSWYKVGQELRERRAERTAEREADREDVRRQKQAEVAGHVLAASLRMCSELHDCASAGMWALAKNPGTDERLRLKAEIDARWERAMPTIKEFFLARDLAQTYLPDPAVETLETIDRLRREIIAFQMIWTSPQIYPSKGELHDAAIAQQRSEVFSKALGPQPQAKAEELRLRIRTELRPLAQLKPHEGSAPVPSKALPPSPRSHARVRAPAEAEAALPEVVGKPVEVTARSDKSGEKPS